MDTEKDYIQFLIKLLVDSITIVIAWFASYFLRFFIIPGGTGDSLEVFIPLSLLVLVLYLFFLNYNKLYASRRAMNWQTEVQLLGLSSLEVFLALVVILYYFYGQRVSRLTIAIFLVLATILLVVERVAINRHLFSLKASGKLTKRVLAIGYGEGLNHYIDEIAAHPEYGLRIIGQFDSHEQGNGKVEQKEGELMPLIEQLEPHIIVIGYPACASETEKKMIGSCYDLIQKVMVIPDLPYSMIGTNIVDFHTIPMLGLNDVDIGFFQRFAKRLFDLISSLLAMVVLSPLLLLLALLVKLTSAGPVLYKQKRVTMDGKEFWMLKYRSMADRPLGEEDGKWTTKDDPRITKVGKFIRKTSLDELPQLFNVVKGEMSLIGPRPERPELVAKFIHEIPGYQLRHKVKAGITGYAQVNGFRGDTSLEGRIEYDLAYIRNWSLLLDFKIFILTFIKGFVNKNAY